MAKPKLILWLVILILVAIVILQNTVVVDFRFLLWKISMSRAVFLVSAVALGFVLGLILPGRWKK